MILVNMIILQLINAILPLITVVNGQDWRKVTDKLVQSATQNIVNDKIIDLLYKGLSSAETGAPYDAKNPFIRTRAEGTGSSAYGPLQMTGGEGSMMSNIYHDPHLANRMGITEDENYYIQQYLEQASQFLEPVSDEVGSTYGYGGSGTLHSKADQEMYQNISRKIIDYEFNQQAGGDTSLFLKNWKMGSGKSMEDFDKWSTSKEGQAYIQRFNANLIS